MTTRSTILDVFVHWSFLAPNSSPTPNPKVSRMPTNLKEMLHTYTNEAFLEGEVTTKMTLSKLQNLLQKVVSDKDHFCQDQYTYVLDSNRFHTKTTIYGITSTEACIHFEGECKLSANLINRELQPIKTEKDWKNAINAAQEIIVTPPAPSTSTRRRKTTPILQNRILHVVVLATKHKVKTTSKKKRPTPSLHSELQPKKKKQHDHFRFKVDSLLVEIHSPIALLK